MSLNDLASRQHADSVRWFPSVHKPVELSGRQHAIAHFALGIAGEAGEIANKVKKHVGYGDQSDQYSEAWLVEHLSDEIPDVLVYLLDLAAELGIDIERSMSDKHGICMGRWEPGFTWDAAPVGHVVPGSGEIIAKTPHVAGWHVTFRRTEVFPGEEWSRFCLGSDVVPVALTSRGLVYPNTKNVAGRAVGGAE